MVSAYVRTYVAESVWLIAEPLWLIAEPRWLIAQPLRLIAEPLCIIAYPLWLIAQTVFSSCVFFCCPFHGLPGTGLCYCGRSILFQALWLIVDAVADISKAY